jgi:hypothetical protein
VGSPFNNYSRPEPQSFAGFTRRLDEAAFIRR